MSAQELQPQALQPQALQILPDSLVANIVTYYKQKAKEQNKKSVSLPFSLDSTHANFKTHNVHAELISAKKMRSTSRFNNQAHKIYLHLVREYELNNCLVLEGVQHCA